MNIPLGELESRLAELPRDRPLVVHCQSGARAAIAASLLRARGVEQVSVFADGYAGVAGGRGGEPSTTDLAAGSPKRFPTARVLVAVLVVVALVLAGPASSAR